MFPKCSPKPPNVWRNVREALPRAFESTAQLVASPDVDVVVVSVRVPHHRELVSQALNAGKSVYCEWPLGNGLAEAVELARLAKGKNLPGMVGIQAIASPEVQYVRKLVVAYSCFSSGVRSGDGLHAATYEKTHKARSERKIKLLFRLPSVSYK